MPKECFLNLPEEKRKKIEKAAIDEFVNYNYDAASTNRIVSNSGISKGSLYQYFEDKKDIYKHVTTLALHEKMNYVTPAMMNPDDHDFFTVIRDMYASGLEFANKHPEFTAIGRRMISDKSHPIYKEVVGVGMEQSYKAFEVLLEKAITRGEIRPDINVKMVAHMIASLSVSLTEYYMDVPIEEWSKHIVEGLDSLLDMIQNGIGSK